MGLNRWSSTGLAVALGAAAAALSIGAAQGQPPPVAGQPPPLSAVPSILRLQPEQRDAWRVYTDAIAQDQATRQNPLDRAQMLNGLQTPQRLDAMLDQMKADETAFQRRAAATKAFYAVLTPDQKQTFDSITRLPTAPSSQYRPSQYRPPVSNMPQPANPQALPPPSGSAQ
jgi:hypothetical protein